MAHSVEVRLPFLDYRLVSFACVLPADQMMRGPWNKYILREAMRGRIPEVVRTRLQGAANLAVPLLRVAQFEMWQNLTVERGSAKPARATGFPESRGVLG